MKRRVRILAALTLAFTMSGMVLSYTRPRFFFGPNLVQPRWPVDVPISIFVNIDSPNITFASQPFEAVRNMFELRSLYTSLRFSLVEVDSSESIGFDGINLVTFEDTPANRSAVFGFAAVAMFRWDNVEGEPVMVEADIVFNSDVSFSTNETGFVDIENLGGHELNHFMSFDHSPVMGSTAFQNAYTEVPNERNLALDDLAAGAFMYPFPDTPALTGSLSGSVEKPGPEPVFGAHVVALRELDGAPVSDISTFGGEWRIDGLPPGQYTVYVEPLDGPSRRNNTLFSGIYRSAKVDRLFQTTFAGGNAFPTIFQVDGGTETPVGAIVVTASAQPLNLQRLGLHFSPLPFTAESAINVTQGDMAYLTLDGAAVLQVPDDGIRVSGPGIDVDSSGVERGLHNGTPYMSLRLIVDPQAEPGVRTIFADNGLEIAALTGGIEIHPSNPYPDLLRNDQVVSVRPLAPALGALLPLDPTGPDNFPGTGEGVWREQSGSDDDDDLYAPRIRSGFVDPDLEVLTDVARPLVFYQLDDASRTLFLGKTDSDRIIVTYIDSPYPADRSRGLANSSR